MLLISVIKYLIVMPDVKDLAQAAQSAAAAPESVNVDFVENEMVELDVVQIGLN
jgi:hypothetical protein